MKCKECKRSFSETHRQDANTVIVQTLCRVCQGLLRENNYRKSVGKPLCAKEEVYDTENKFQRSSKAIPKELREAMVAMKVAAVMNELLGV